MTSLTHIRATQHWTYCRAKVSLVRKTCSTKVAAGIVLAARRRGKPLTNICAMCVDRWRNDPQRQE